jgi:undecaprenyl-diphosphatase
LNLINSIIEKDRELFIYLNALGIEHWDTFWLTVTDKYTWLPIYGVLLFLLFWYYGWKKALILIFIVALLITFTDQFVNLIKYTTHRLRPNHDPSLQDIIRILKNSGGYSFVSGHATNSFAVSTFMIATLRNYFKPIYLILVWPILFMYSRIYVGVHYPMDVALGMILGIVIGYGFYKFSLLILPKINASNKA